MKTLFAFAAPLLYILVNIYVISEVRSTLVQIYPTMCPISATMRPIRSHQKAARRTEAKRRDVLRCEVKCVDKWRLKDEK